MFRIRRILMDGSPGNIESVGQVMDIMKTQFPEVTQREIWNLPEKLKDPLKYRFQYMLFVAEDARGRVKGFSILMHAPDLRFCYLDYISTARRLTGRGIGGALYQRMTEEARALGSLGLFLEALPDDPRLSPDPEVRKQNVSRLRFYEGFGVRPIADTAYETPLRPGDTDPPYLLYDDLGKETPLGKEEARGIVKAILERKYKGMCPPEYVDMVVASFKDDPVHIRPPKYIKRLVRPPPGAQVPEDMRITLVVNDRHTIHNVKERGYVESPVRIKTIMKELDTTGLFQKVKAGRFSMDHIKNVHDPGFVDYLKNVCMDLEPGESVYPYVFPIRNAARPPKELAMRAGYYCIDTFTPLGINAYLAARGAVDCALTCAEDVLKGTHLAYALVRPPGHHAETKVFGGFCYFNSAAIAAHFLSGFGRVAVLDVDYHHGNGTQEIFYRRKDVLTVSIHGHPRYTYPYFSGYEVEEGEGDGAGYNHNYPMQEGIDGERYGHTLVRALNRIRKFSPVFLVVSLGLDTAKGDPTGSWKLNAKDFEANGRSIGGLGYPTLVVQEGGYDNRVLGVNARNFFKGLWEGTYKRQ